MKKTMGKTMQLEMVKTLRKGLANVGMILHAIFFAVVDTTNQSRLNAQQQPKGKPSQAVLSTSKVIVPDYKAILYKLIQNTITKHIIIV